MICPEVSSWTHPVQVWSSYLQNWMILDIRLYGYLQLATASSRRGVSRWVWYLIRVLYLPCNKPCTRTSTLYYTILVPVQ